MNESLIKEPLAIIGMACRLPRADGLDAFWRLLSEGQGAISEFPDHKLDRELYVDPRKGQRGKTYSTVGGFISERPVNFSGVSIDPTELADADLSHQIFAEVAIAACANAGFDPSAIPHENTGVYVGHSGGSPTGGELALASLASQMVDYLNDVPAFLELPETQRENVCRQLVQELRLARPHRKPNGGPNVAASCAAELVARILGLSGPHLVIDAACASSLVALAVGGLALQTNQIDMAIVGGASYNKADSLILFSHAQSCSATGTRPFDEQADGLVSSEGYVAFVLKTLARAERDGNRIQAVIRGLGISTDGRGRSLWAPRREGQLEALRRAYSSPEQARSVQLLEAHATSTQVGDATEMEALNDFFRPLVSQTIPVGSVKSNIGHTLETAGLAGLLKVVLSLQHGIIPPSINVHELNKTIPWSNVPFRVPTQSEPWPRSVGTPRRAGVNAFGIGGLNVHVVVDEYDRAVTSNAPVTEAHPSNSTEINSVQTSSSQIDSTPVRGSSDFEPIAIIGRGVVLPGAFNVAEFAKFLADNRTVLGPPTAQRWRKGIGINRISPGTYEAPHNIGGYIHDFQYDWKLNKIPPKQVAQANPLQFMLLDAATQALREAGYDQRPLDRAHTAVVVGTMFGGEFANQLQMGLRLPEISRSLVRLLVAQGLDQDRAKEIAESYENEFLKARPALLDETGSFTASTLASRLTKTLDLMGGAMAIDAGEASSMAALATACNLLRTSVCTHVLCAAAQSSMDLTTFESLTLKRRLKTESTTGCLPAEGVAVVVLKRWSDALRDNDRVLGLIHNSVAAHATDDLALAYSTSAERGRAMRGFRFANVDRVEAGNGVTDEDQSLRIGLRLNHGSSETLPVDSSLAERMGNLMGAHGLAALIKASIRFEQGLEHSSVVCNHTPRGLAWQVALESPSPVAPIALTPPPTTGISRSPLLLFRLGATDPEKFKSDVMAISNESLANYLTRPFSPACRSRLAIVADSLEGLAAKVSLVRTCLARPESYRGLEDQGIYMNLARGDQTRTDQARTDKQRIAFLFPGQGSQYPGMLQHLISANPRLGEIRDEADRIMRSMGAVSFDELTSGATDQLGTDVWATQAAMLVADCLMWTAIQQLGISPDCVAGHSLGEFAALFAAGTWTLDEALRVTRARADAINQCPSPRGSMISINASVDQVSALIARHRSEVFVTHRNAPTQTVVGGSNRSIRELAAILDAEGVDAKILAVPAAFHTPLMQSAQGTFGQALERVQLRPPRIPVLSSVTNRYVADPWDIRHNLVAQLVSPVLYVELVQRLVQDGITNLIEVGPQQVLTRLNRQIVGDADITLIATDHPKRNSTEQLLRVCAKLEARGLVVGPDGESTDRHSKLRTPVLHEVEHFDATLRRRNRGKGLVRTEHRSDSGQPIESFDATMSRISGRRSSPANSRPSITSKPNAGELPSQDSQLPAPALNVDAREKLNNQTKSVSRPDRLERFLIDFVVDQTGYPAEIIELDWDLEADLGIDSIKRAQLFGELREYFDLDAHSDSAKSKSGKSAGSPNGNNNSSLDSFRTLRQILALLETVPGKGDWLRDDPATVESPVDLAGSFVHENTHPRPDESGKLESDLAVRVPSVRPAATESSNDAMAKFLIDFVVEQTGYPPEVVDLEADLEADLGIDSIKKAQLFGELRESFSIKLADGDRNSLNEFRTLKQVLQVLQTADPSTKSAQSNGHSASYHLGLESGRAKAGILRNELKRWVRERSSFVNAEHGLASTEAIALDDAEIARTHGEADGIGVDRVSWLAYRRSKRVQATLPVVADNSAIASITTAPNFAAAPTLAAPSTPAAPSTLAESTVQVDPEPPLVTSRYVLRVEQRVWPNSPQPVLHWNGDAVILGRNPLAERLEQRLFALGVRSHILDTTEGPNGPIDALEQIWSKHPAPHLFIVTSRDSNSETKLDEAEWRSRMRQGVEAPFWVCQRWLKRVVEAGLMDSATIVGVSSLGGGFGLDSDPRAVEGGAISGLLKAILIESWVNGFRTTPIKTIDAPPAETADSIIDGIFSELSHSSYDMEIGYVASERRVIRAHRQPLTSSERRPIPHGGTWVCTGGARGITAYVAKELSRRFNWRLHLIGKSPSPEIPNEWRSLDPTGTAKLRSKVMQEARANGRNPIKAWQETEKAIEIDANLREFTALGIEATYHSCDVARRSDLASVLDKVRRQSGPIVGILHGAGVGKDSRFEQKDPGKVAECFAAKVDGAAALMELTRHDPIQYFVGFGSISGRFGANGHTDYSAANDMLCKLIGWYRHQRPEVASVGFHWHAWGDVGMATKPETRLALEMIDMQFMPAAEGVRHLIAELEAGAPESEVLITDDKYYRTFYPAETIGSDRPISRTSVPGPRVSNDSSQSRSVPLPLLDRGRTRQELTQVIHELTLAPTADPFLTHHRLDDRPLLPLVIGVELLAEAAQYRQPDRHLIGLHDVRALHGLKFHTDRDKTIRVRSSTLGDSQIACQVVADFLARNGQRVEADRVHMEGEADFAFEPWIEYRSLGDIPGGAWDSVEYPAKKSKFYLGPPMQCLRKILVEDTTAWGRIAAPALVELAGSRHPADGWLIPSAALDACLFATGILAWKRLRPSTALPAKIGRIRLGRLPRPGETCFVHVRFQGWVEVQARFDFCLLGDDGRILVDVKDYCIAWVG